MRTHQPLRDVPPGDSATDYQTNQMIKTLGARQRCCDRRREPDPAALGGPLLGFKTRPELCEGATVTADTAAAPRRARRAHGSAALSGNA